MPRISRWILGFFTLAVMPAGAAERATPDRAELDRRYEEAIAIAQSTGESTPDESVDARKALLRKILEDAPDYQPARAELGEVKVDGRWLPVDYAQHLASQDERLVEYEELRQQADDDVDDHQRLARWCEKQGLDYEARPHWLRVVQAKPRHSDALDGLNAVWHDGSLWDAELAEQAKADRKQRVRSAEEWEERFQHFERSRYVREEEFAEIRDQFDAAAMGPIERRVAALLGPLDPTAAERAEQLVDVMFDQVDRLDDVEVTASLCRIATLGGEEHRRKALDALRDRPQFDTMPLLLSALIAPMDSSYRIIRNREGDVTYEHRLRRDGPETTQVHNRMRTADVQVRMISPSGQNFGSYTTNGSFYQALIQARFEGLKNQIAYQSEAAQADSEVIAHNTMAAEINRGVVAALTDLSGLNLGNDPGVWWDHWRRQTGYEVYDQPTERTYDVTYKLEDVVANPTLYYIPPPPPRPRCECFVAGTPVWTRTGQTAIEDLKRGDLVLARDPHRGGLTYQAVLETTVRQPSPMVAIDAADETIRATVGHPFWVVGEGWTMAEKLKPGDLLSTIDGPKEVKLVSTAPKRQAYNLVVEGAANYYVGEAGMLVHDNTPRRPAVGLMVQR